MKVVSGEDLRKLGIFTHRCNNISNFDEIAVRKTHLSESSDVVTSFVAESLSLSL